MERFAPVLRLVPLLVAVVLAALWNAGAPRKVPDLRLSAPVVARPGSSIGLRAWELGVDDEGYSVVRAPAVQIELRDERGAVLAKTTLQSSQVQGREGSMAIGERVAGELTLRASATIEGEEVTVDRTLYVREGIDSKLPTGRSINAFQAYELEPLRVSDSSRAPKTIDPRIEEGACAPELHCTLSVWVGDWDGRVRLRSLGGVRVDGPLARTEAGFAHFELLVVGQEALVALEALGHDGTVFASRRVRLPLVPGALITRSTRTSQQASEVRLAWSALGDAEQVLVDVFDGHRWVMATSMSAGESQLTLPGPGVWRIQLRSDLYSDNRAGVGFQVVDEPGGPEALRLAADALIAGAEQEGLDPLAMSILEGRFRGDPDAALRALFAIPSFDVVSVGSGMSSSVAPDGELDQAQERRRAVAAGVIVLLGLFVSMVLLRVELLARARAQRLLESLDDSPPPKTGSSGRGLWAFVLLVFVLIAVLALSKRWF